MITRVLITGAQGFVGSYVVPALAAALGENGEIHQTSRGGAGTPLLGTVGRLDVTDIDAVHREVARVRPTHILHLAGLSTIAEASADENLAWNIHLFGALNLARAVLQGAPSCVLLHVGSGQVYGASAHSTAMLSEETPLAPTNVQMASKAAADLAMGAMASDGLRSVRLRPFNHTGPRQAERFVLPSIAFQIARIKSGIAKPRMMLGNIDVERDFLDVRDVASAYVMAILRSDDICAGEIFNISSGVPRSIRDVVAMMLHLSGTTAAIDVDSRRVRSTEIKRFVGDASKARRHLAWSPAHSFERTLRDLLEYAEREVRSEISG